MKIIKLTGNELRKLFARKSTILVILLALLMAFAVPYMDYYSRNSYYSSPDYYQENIRNEMLWYEERIPQIKQEIKDGGESYLYYDLSWNEAYLDAMQLKLDAGVSSWDDWREDFAYEGYVTYLQELFAIEPYLDGNKKLIKAYEECGLSGHIDGEALNYYYEKDSTKKLKERYKEVEAFLESIRNAYMENDIDVVNKYYYDKQQAVIDGIEDNIDELNKQRRELIKYNFKGMNDDAIKNIKEQIKKLEDSIPFEEELLKWKQYRIDHKITPGYSSWQSQCMNVIDSAVTTLNEEAMDKDSYEAGGGQWNDDHTAKLTYDEYLIKFENRQIEAADNIAFYTYAIENNITPLDYTYSTRSRLLDYLYLAVYAGAFVAIILGCAIVSREYSKGTIRLLLIRPVKRWKILLSKVLSVLLLSFIIFALYAVITGVSTVSLFGTEDYNMPVIEMVNHEIVSRHITEIALPPLYKSAVTVLFTGSMSILLSTVFKSTVLGVGLPTITLIGGNLIAMLLLELKYNAVAKFTPFVYLNLWQLIHETGSLSYYLEDIPGYITADFGFIYLLLSSVAMLAITFAVFEKRDVKN